MAELPFLSTTVTDYLAQTAHLSPEGRSAYGDLRYHYWLRQGRPLPTDYAELARLARVSPSVWRKVSGAVLEFFLVTPEGYRHEELDKALARAQLRSAKAKDSVGHRWKKDQLEPTTTIRTYNERTTPAPTNGKRPKYSPSPSSSFPYGKEDGRPPNPRGKPGLSDHDPKVICVHCGTIYTDSAAWARYCTNRECPTLIDDALKQTFVSPEKYPLREGALQ